MSNKWLIIFFFHTDHLSIEMHMITITQFQFRLDHDRIQYNFIHFVLICHFHISNPSNTLSTAENLLIVWKNCFTFKQFFESVRLLNYDTVRMKIIVTII